MTTPARDPYWLAQAVVARQQGEDLRDAVVRHAREAFEKYAALKAGEWPEDPMSRAQVEAARKSWAGDVLAELAALTGGVAQCLAGGGRLTRPQTAQLALVLAELAMNLSTLHRMDLGTLVIEMMRARAAAQAEMALKASTPEPIRVDDEMVSRLADVFGMRSLSRP